MAEVEAETRRGRKASWRAARSTPSSCRAAATREVEFPRAAMVLATRLVEFVTASMVHTESPSRRLTGGWKEMARPSW